MSFSSSIDPALVTLRGIFQARKKVYRHLKPTPLLHHPLLEKLLGCEAYVKHENCNPTGSFKVRGGINLISGLNREERQRGVITATRGNHGQSIALASKLYGVRCTIAIPEGNNPEKNSAMEAFGAQLLIHGKDFDDARLKVEELQKRNGMRYVHSGNEPALIHGVGTYALEIIEELPEVDSIIVPVGGGSGVCGVLTVVRQILPGVRVIGVQAEAAPAVYRSWKEGVRVETESSDTVADGLATRAPFELTFSIMRKFLDEMITVSDEEILEAVYDFLLTTHHLAEPAAAATLAAARRLQNQLAGKKVVLVMSGGNIASGLLREVLSRFSERKRTKIPVS